VQCLGVRVRVWVCVSSRWGTYPEPHRITHSESDVTISSPHRDRSKLTGHAASTPQILGVDPLYTFSIIFSRKKKDKGDKAAMGCATSSASASTRDEEEDVFEVGGLLGLSWLT
jgi:hypothetical protein